MSKFNENRATAQLAELVALESGVHPVTARKIRTAAALHDIGKLKLDKRILNKPDKLDEREYEIIKTHTTLGAEILSGIQGELGVMARNICLWHHEKHDGTGYWHKKPDELPPYIKYVTISDIFVALLCERPYKHAWPPKDALDYIYLGGGFIFDPALTNTFISLVHHDSRIPAIFMKTEE